MSEEFRRVILKPPGLDDQRLSRLREALAAAVALQKQLAAQSPHVLQIVGDLQEDESGFFFRHEPARPLDIARLFDASTTAVDASALIRMAAAIVDALRVAHEIRQPRPAVHGGICPGVILIAEDGIEKLSDFAVAPAICAILGADAYTNLAVGPPRPGAVTAITGIWEILAPDVFDRDDRICAFIDPEKHGTRLYNSFESCSDLVAAGFVLHLMAEHRHPYFYDAPLAHRSIEEVEFGMPLAMPTTARRKDLRESEDAAVKAWRELVPRMMDRLPEKRPSAAAIADALARAGCRPIDAAERLRRQMEASLQILSDHPLHEVPWERVCETAAFIGAAADAPPEAKGDAEAVTELAGAVALFQQADWMQSMAIVERLSARKDIHSATVGKAQEAARILGHNRAVSEELDDIETCLGGEAAESPTGQITKLAELEERAEAVEGAAPFLPAVAERLADLKQRLVARRKEAVASAQQLRGEIERWLSGLQLHLREAAWERLEAEAGSKAELVRAFDDLLPQFRQIQARLQQHRDHVTAVKRRREELSTLLRKAEQDVQQEKFDQALRNLEAIERQDDLPDLSERAYALRVRIEEEQERRRRRQEEIRQSRANVDRLLESAASLLDADSMAGLDRADEQVLVAMDIADRTDAQKRRAEELLGRIQENKKRLLDEGAATATRLAAAESEYNKAVDCYSRGELSDAERIVRTLLECDHPLIRGDAGRLLEEIGSVREAQRAEMQARLDEAVACMESGDQERAADLAMEVAQNESTQDELRKQALQLLAKVDDARKAVEEARQRGAQEYQRAVAALREGQARRARVWVDRVAANSRVDSLTRGAVERLMAALPEIERAEGLLAEDSVRESLRLLDEFLGRAREDQSSPVCEAARKLRERARERLVQAMDKGIRALLEARVRQAGGSEGGSFEAGVGGALPAWVLETLTPLDEFLQDCTLTGQEAVEQERLEPGHHLGAKYEIIEFLGRGGMGQVYRARDLKLNREVALKLARPAEHSSSLAEALQNEAQAIARLKHPHIFRVNSYDVIDGWHCFDTDYMRGQDMSQYASKHELSGREIAAVLIPIAEALGYAHAQGVLHRDVKPQNIYLGDQPGEGPWLIDFGLARMRSICDHRAHTGLCGTPGYIAPEVITSMGEEVDHRADIFALGCVLYGLLAGRAPFSNTQTGRTGLQARGSIARESLDAHGRSGERLTGSWRDMSGSAISRVLLNTVRSDFVPLDRVGRVIPEALQSICEKALACDPRHRHQDAAEFAAELRRFIADMDEEQTRAELAKARRCFESRRQGELAELDDLDAARRTAEAAAKGGQESTKSEADRLLQEIERVRTTVQHAQERGRDQFQVARECVARARWGAALMSARDVLAIPYVPELHDDARRIEAEARSQLQATGRRLWKTVICCIVVIGLIGGGIAVYKARTPQASPPVAVGRSQPERQQPPVGPSRAEVGPRVSETKPEAAVVSVTASRSAEEPTPVVPTRPGIETPPTVATKPVTPPGPKAVSPRIISVSCDAPSGKVLKAGDTFNVNVKFSEDVVVLGSPRLALSDGLSADYVDGSGTDTLVFRCRIDDGRNSQRLNHAGSDSLRLNGGSIKESDGDAPAILALSEVASGTSFNGPAIKVDSKSPTVVTVISSDDKSRTYKGGDQLHITVRFDEAVRVTGKPRVSMALGNETRNATFDEAAWLKNKAELSFVFTVGERDLGSLRLSTAAMALSEGARITDEADNAFADTTLRDVERLPEIQVDGVRPVVAPLSPGSGATLEQLTTVRVEFTEAVRNVSPRHLTVRGKEARDAGPEPGSDGKRFAFTGDWQNLTGDIEAALRVRAQDAQGRTSEIQDLAGNGLTSDVTWVFHIKLPAVGWSGEELSQRQALEAMLKNLPSGSPVPADSLGRCRTQLARIKWMLAADPQALPTVESRVDQLRTELDRRNSGVVSPNRFVEYFWGPESVHAFRWCKAAGSRSVEVTYFRLERSEALLPMVREALKPTGASGTGTLDRLGQALLGNVVQPPFFTSDGAPGPFGVVVAPDGPMCLLPLTDLKFGTQATGTLRVSEAREGISRGEMPGSVTTLRDVCQMPYFKNSATGVWIMVSLEPVDGIPDLVRLWSPAAAMVINRKADGQIKAAPLRNMIRDSKSASITRALPPGDAFFYPAEGPAEESSRMWLLYRLGNLSELWLKSISLYDSGLLFPRLKGEEQAFPYIFWPPVVVAAPVPGSAR